MAALLFTQLARYRTASLWLPARHLLRRTRPSSLDRHWLYSPIPGQQGGILPAESQLIVKIILKLSF